MGLFDWLFGKKQEPESTLGPASPTPSPKSRGRQAFKVGDRVLARWFDSYFYLGSVRELEGDRCQIDYDDGERAWVHQANVRRPDVAVGSQIFCRTTERPAYLPAVVEQQIGEKVRVRYDGGDEEWTTLSFVRVRRSVVDVGEDPRPVAGNPPMGAAGMNPAGNPMGAGMPMAGGGMPGMMGQPQILDVGEPRDDPNWRTGDRVLARWWDYFWYPGTLLAIGVKGFHVVFDDGDQRVLQHINLMPLVVEEGESLFVRPKNQPQLIYMPATVTRVKGEVIDVEFEDGASETNTRISRARIWRCPVGYSSFAFEEGERVLGLDMDGFTYAAEIVSIDEDKVIVQFLDGPERMLTPELIRRFELPVGGKIECRWKGGPQFFPGVLSKREGDRLFINYDDGDQEWSNIRLMRLPPRDESARGGSK